MKYLISSDNSTPGCYRAMIYWDGNEARVYIPCLSHTTNINAASLPLGLFISEEMKKTALIGEAPGYVVFEGANSKRPIIIGYFGDGIRSIGGSVSDGSTSDNMTEDYIPTEIPDLVGENFTLEEISNLSKAQYLELVCPIYQKYCAYYNLKYPGVLALQVFYEVNANFPAKTSNVARKDNNLGGLKYSASVPGATRGTSVPSNETGGNYCHFNSLSDYYRAHTWQIGTSNYYSAARSNQGSVTSFTRTLLNTWVHGNINEVPSGAVSYSESIIKDYTYYKLDRFENDNEDFIAAHNSE